MSAPTSKVRPEVLVVGAGIAGASAAYWAAQAGFAVTVVDSGEGTASHVPSALLNPVRGQSGRVPPRALKGLALTWALVEAVDTPACPVPHGRSGVVRPVPDAAAQQRFARNLVGAEVPHEWRAPADFPALAPGWHTALWLPEAGWLDGRVFCEALLAASGAQRLTGRVLEAAENGHIYLEDGRRLTAQAVIWCGGSVGARAGRGPQSCRAGTLLTLARMPGAVPLSFGAYLAPAQRGAVLGATFERPAPAWVPPAFPLASLAWLLEKGARLTPLGGLEVTGQWSGTRLSGLRAGRAGAAQWELSGLGSKGFLLGPLLARDVVADVAAHFAG